MSIVPDINANLNTRLDVIESCNCCFPKKQKKNKDIKTSEKAQEVLKTSSNNSKK